MIRERYIQIENPVRRFICPLGIGSYQRRCGQRVEAGLNFAFRRKGWLIITTAGL